MIRLPTEVQARLTNAQLTPYLETIVDECAAHGYLLHLTAILGVGTFGTVFLAEQAGEMMAMKISVPQPGLERLFAPMCEEEGRKSCALASIPEVAAGREYWFAAHAPLFFLALRYVHGMSLYTYLGRTPTLLSEARVRAWALQLISGLSAMHQLGVVHRDLKPENILLEVASDRVYITDLGIAKYARARTLLDLRSTGTHPYAPPEQIRGSSTHKSDQYALGIVLFELATRTDAAASIPAPKFGYPVARPLRLAPRQHNAALSPGFAALIERLAQLSPANRFPSMQAAHEALLALADQTELALVRQHLPPELHILALRPTERLRESYRVVEENDAVRQIGSEGSVAALAAPGDPSARLPLPQPLLPGRRRFSWQPGFHLRKVLVGGRITLGGPELSRGGTLCLMALYYCWLVAAGLGAGFAAWAISGDSSQIDWALAGTGVAVWWFMVRTWNIGVVRRRGNLNARKRGWLFLLWVVLIMLAVGLLLWSLLLRPDMLLPPAWLAVVGAGLVWLCLYGGIEVWVN